MVVDVVVVVDAAAFYPLEDVGKKSIARGHTMMTTLQLTEDWATHWKTSSWTRRHRKEVESFYR